MLDKRFILENAELVQENSDRRGVRVDISRFVELESQRRKLQAEVEELSRQANVVSKSIGQSKDDAEREAAVTTPGGPKAPRMLPCVSSLPAGCAQFAQMT